MGTQGQELLLLCPGKQNLGNPAGERLEKNQLFPKDCAEQRGCSESGLRGEVKSALASPGTRPGPASAVLRALSHLSVLSPPWQFVLVILRLNSASHNLPH